MFKYFLTHNLELLNNPQLWADFSVMQILKIIFKIHTITASLVVGKSLLYSIYYVVRKYRNMAEPDKTSFLGINAALCANLVALQSDTIESKWGNTPNFVEQKWWFLVQVLFFEYVTTCMTIANTAGVIYCIGLIVFQFLIFKTSVLSELRHKLATIKLLVSLILFFNLLIGSILSHILRELLLAFVLNLHINHTTQLADLMRFEQRLKKSEDEINTMQIIKGIDSHSTSEHRNSIERRNSIFRLSLLSHVTSPSDSPCASDNGSQTLRESQLWQQEWSKIESRG